MKLNFSLNLKIDKSIFKDSYNLIKLIVWSLFL